MTTHNFCETKLSVESILSTTTFKGRTCLLNCLHSHIYSHPHLQTNTTKAPQLVNVSYTIQRFLTVILNVYTFWHSHYVCYSLSLPLFFLFISIPLAFSIVVACAFPPRFHIVHYVKRAQMWHRMCLISMFFQRTHTNTHHFHITRDESYINEGVRCACTLSTWCINHVKQNAPHCTTV